MVMYLLTRLTRAGTILFLMSLPLNVILGWNITTIIIITGVLVIGWMSLSPMIFSEEGMVKYASPFHSYLSIVFRTVVIFIVGFLLGNVGNKLFKKNK
ncbi:MAG: hypothetical protein JXR41_13365 [Bacteroidales bacterium]|nr:hypothetical protein [Bacteroidales bacterium]